MYLYIQNFDLENDMTPMTAPQEQFRRWFVEWTNGRHKEPARGKGTQPFSSFARGGKSGRGASLLDADHEGD